MHQEARGWRVYGRHPAGQQEAFGRGSAALGIAQGLKPTARPLQLPLILAACATNATSLSCLFDAGVSEWTEIAEPSLAISKLAGSSEPETVARDS